jgi:hypothetical protein
MKKVMMLAILALMVTASLFAQSTAWNPSGIFPVSSADDIASVGDTTYVVVGSDIYMYVAGVFNSVIQKPSFTMDRLDLSVVGGRVYGVFVESSLTRTVVFEVTPGGFTGNYTYGGWYSTEKPVTIKSGAQQGCVFLGIHKQDEFWISRQANFTPSQTNLFLLVDGEETMGWVQQGERTTAIDEEGTFYSYHHLNGSQNIMSLPQINNPLAMTELEEATYSNGWFAAVLEYGSGGGNTVHRVFIDTLGAVSYMGQITTPLNYDGDKIFSIDVDDDGDLDLVLDGGVGCSNYVLRNEDDLANPNHFLAEPIQGTLLRSMDIPGSSAKRLIGRDCNNADIVTVYSPQFPTATDLVVQKKIDVNIFPNPAREMITISSDETFVSCSIFSVNGKFLLVSDEKQVNVSDLAAGVYVARITTDVGVIAKRFVKIQ